MTEIVLFDWRQYIFHVKNSYMKSGFVFLESLVVGTGTFLFLVLCMYLVFGVDATALEEVSEFLYWDMYGWMLLAPLVGVICILGIITEHLSFAVFWPWENLLRRSIQPLGASEDQPLSKTFFYELRAYLFTSQEASELARMYHYLRAKINIARGSSINALCIFALLIYQEINLEGFHPLLMPGILLSGLIFIGGLFTWYLLVTHELRWIERYNEILLK